MRKTRCLTWDRSNSLGLLVAARARFSGRTPASPAAPATAAALPTKVRRPILGPEGCLRFSVINVSSSSRGPCASGPSGGGRAGGVAGLGEAGDFGDLAVGGVGDVEVVGAGVDRDPVGGVELGRGGGLAAALAAGRGGAAGGGGGVDDGGDAPGRGDFADGVVEGVGDEQVAGAVDGDALGVVEAGGGGGAAVAGEAAEAVAGLVGGVVAGDGGDDPGLGVDPADDVVGRVGDVEVALRVDGEAGGGVQLGERGQAAVSGVAGRAVAGDGHDLPLRGDLDDPVVVGVGDEHVPGGVDS